MRFLALISLFILFTCQQRILADDVKQLPDEFFGTWELGESINFDEYLEAKGVGWLLRKIIESAPCTRIFTKRSDSTFRLQIITPKNKVDWDQVELGKQFTADYLDEKSHKITLSYKTDGGRKRLVEEHITQSLDKPEIYEYLFDTTGAMYMTMEAKGIIAKRFYHKD